jgi:hypothetical protein
MIVVLVNADPVDTLRVVGLPSIPFRPLFSALCASLFTSFRSRALRPLPPYSPDFHPLEQCWSKVKEFLRAAEARTADALQQAIANAFATVTASDAPGWFQHCGYRLT